MPYNVLNLSTGEMARDGDAIACFESPAYAANWAAELTRLTGEKHQVRVVVSDDWIMREAARFDSGEYLPVAWQYADFWRSRSRDIYLHFCHRSKDKPAFIAFTESPEKGARDIQTRLRPGVYLKRYFGDVLTDAEITHYARLHAMISGETDYEIKFAVTADEIEHVYTNGPASCMSPDVSDFSSEIHPVRVYGDSDLQVAYIEAPSGYHDADIMARALIWPERKVYGRVYPTPERYIDNAREEARAAQGALITALESLGYTSGRFDGARIKRIESRHGGFVMPYLDGTQEITDRGDCFEINSRGEFTATNTNGLLESGELCESCEEYCSGEDMQTVYTSRHNTQSWCTSCVESGAFYCHGNEETYADGVDSVTGDDGYTYSIYYARDEMYYCERTRAWNHDGTIIVHTGKDATQQWCQDAVNDDAFFCHGSEEYYSCDTFESVEIDGEIYEESYAFLHGLLSKQSDETESETV